MTELGADAVLLGGEGDQEEGEMLGKKRREREAERRFQEAEAAEWARRGIVLEAPTNPAFRKALRDAGLDFGSPEYARVLIEVLSAAKERLSHEDRLVIFGGR
jgi:hypothetical protein